MSRQQVRIPVIGSPKIDTAESVQAIRAAEVLHRFWRRIEALANKFFTSRWNPLYQSGSLAILFLTVTSVTGLWLLLFYRISDPYASLIYTVEQAPLGNWTRTLHRYSADLAVAAIVLHALKMFLAGKTWGPRALAWCSGVLMSGIVLLCGWTGFIMAWDVQGQWVAQELARIIDLAPILSEPLSRSFSSNEHLPASFFFMNLFLHVAMPLGVIIMGWVHVARTPRPKLFPPRAMLWATVALVGLLAALLPAPVLPPADVQQLPGRMPLDLWYGFWIPLSLRISPGIHVLLWLAAATVLLTAPWWWRPRGTTPRPSVVDKDLCTGCTQCYEDCPYDAISMVDRDPPHPSRSEFVAWVDSDRCVACGICAGSCGPMSIGPPQRSGRNQLDRVRAWLDSPEATDIEVVVLLCGKGGTRSAELQQAAGPRVAVLEVGCIGAVHTTNLEVLLRGGVGGIYLWSCPPRDALFREGPQWTHERLYEDREAELHARVDRQRIRLGRFGAGEHEEGLRDIAALQSVIRELGFEAAQSIEPELECEPPTDTAPGGPA